MVRTYLVIPLRLCLAGSISWILKFAGFHQFRLICLIFDSTATMKFHVPRHAQAIASRLGQLHYFFLSFARISQTALCKNCNFNCQRSLWAAKQCYLLIGLRMTCDPIIGLSDWPSHISKSLFRRAALWSQHESFWTEFKRLAFKVLGIFDDHRDKCAVYWNQVPNICCVMYYLFAEIRKPGRRPSWTMSAPTQIRTGFYLIHWHILNEINFTLWNWAVCRSGSFRLWDWTGNPEWPQTELG